MADIVNLRQFKKQKARSDREALAEQNRALHGRTKAEKQRDRSSAERAEKFVDGHRREPRSGKVRPVSLVEKRSVTIRGHRTSYSLEKPFYDDLVAIAAARGMTLAALVADVDANRPRDGQSVLGAPAIRAGTGKTRGSQWGQWLTLQFRLAQDHGRQLALPIFRNTLRLDQNH